MENVSKQHGVLVACSIVQLFYKYRKLVDSDAQLDDVWIELRYVWRVLEAKLRGKVFVGLAQLEKEIVR
jgi:hypothetical protein